MKIPFLGGWTSILTQLFWCEQKGYYWFWHTAIYEYVHADRLILTFTMIYAMIIHSAMVPWSFILHHLASTDTVLPRGARISAGQFQYNSWTEVWARSGSFGTSGRVESRQGAFHMASPSAWLCLRASSELWDAGRGVRALREPLVSQWWSFGTHHVSPLQSGGEHGGYSRVEGSGGQDGILHGHIIGTSICHQSVQHG